MTHAARGESTACARPTDEEVNELIAKLENTPAQQEEVSEFLLSHAERRRRRLLHLEPASDAPTFYRHIQITGGKESCLHGVGLELFGDVHEE